MKAKYTIAVACVIATMACVIFSFQSQKRKWGFAFVECDTAPSLIIFIPGLQTKNISAEEYTSMLTKLFPDSPIQVIKWESDWTFLEWSIAVNRADLFVDSMVDMIEKKPKEEQEKLILIGHSLGGRIAVRALAKLADKKIRIRRGIFLGAAIPDDDEDIYKAIQASLKPCVNISNREDYMLRNAYGIFGENTPNAYLKGALGAYGSRLRYPKFSLFEYKVIDDIDIASGVKAEKSKGGDNKYGNHEAKYYIAELGRRLADIRRFDIMFLTSNPRRWSVEKDTWKLINQIQGWQLRKHCLTDQYQIMSPWENILLINEEVMVKEVFESLEKRIKDADSFNALNIVVDQGDNNTLMKVIPCDSFWTLDDYIDGWLLQHHLFGKYRIVDNRDIQRANGSKEQMKASFEKIKFQLQQK